MVSRFYESNSIRSPNFLFCDALGCVCNYVCPGRTSFTRMLGLGTFWRWNPFFGIGLGIVRRQTASGALPRNANVPMPLFPALKFGGVNATTKHAALTAATAETLAPSFEGRFSAGAALIPARCGRRPVRRVRPGDWPVRRVITGHSGRRDIIGGRGASHVPGRNEPALSRGRPW